jgi:hypothetical protein
VVEFEKVIDDVTLAERDVKTVSEPADTVGELLIVCDAVAPFCDAVPEREYDFSSDSESE